jgi:hypothetical protein
MVRRKGGVLHPNKNKWKMIRRKVRGRVVEVKGENAK